MQRHGVMTWLSLRKIILIVLVYSSVSWARPDAGDIKATALDLRNSMELESVVSKVSGARVIYVGETHDNYADHMIQLQIIRMLHARNPDIAIGMEQFQQPFQDVLDRFIMGELDENGLIRQSEWTQRWRYDYRLYRPILSYAREHHIPVIALNASKEIVSMVSEKGMDGLSADERKKLPEEIDDSDQGYRGRLQEIYEGHAHKGKRGFDGFMQVQLLWDESMASRAAEYLRANPERQLVVLAGSGHLLYGSGIPQRVSRRVKLESAIILPAGEFTLSPGIADFLVQGADEKLPEKGLLGIYPEDSADGLRAKELVPHGAAYKAGVKEDDLILSVNNTPVQDMVDLDIALMDTSPGETVNLVIIRRSMILQDEEMQLQVKLGK